MLIPFYSKAAGDFFMQEAHVRTLFGLMGLSFAPQGVVMAAELNACIAQLNAALDSTACEAAKDTGALADSADQQEPAAVGLKQRAWPLLDMMQRAAKKNVDVVWGVKL